MDRHPLGRSVLHAAQRQNHEGTLEPCRQDGASMSQDPVVAEIDALAEDVDARDHDDQTGPGEQPWDDCRQCQ